MKVRERNLSPEELEKIRTIVKQALSDIEKI
jgi:hypothetical protein